MHVKLSRRFWPVLLLTAVAGVGPSFARPTSTAATPAELVKAIDTFAAEALHAHTTAGLVVGIADHGRPLVIGGYGAAKLENNTRAAANSVFPIGSVTKQFTATAILLLAERGKLSLDDPLSRYFPNFSRGGEVTIRSLLNHTSGVHNYTSEKDFLDSTSRRELTTAQIVDLIAHLDKLYDFAPGTSSNYRNSGYVLLGAIVEQVSKQPYATFLKADVFDPAGLADTRVDNLVEIVPYRASGFEKASTAATGFVNAEYISMSAAAAAGAIRSTAADRLRWHTALLGGKVLKPASLAMMLSPGRLKNGALASTLVLPTRDTTEPRSDYGFALSFGRTKGCRSIAQGGSINGFNAELTTFPDDRITVVLLTNTGGVSYALAPKLYDIVLASHATTLSRPNETKP